MKLRYEVIWELDDEIIDHIVGEIEATVNCYPNINVNDYISKTTEEYLIDMDFNECDHFNMDDYIDEVVEEVKHRYYDRKQKSTATPTLPKKELHSGCVRRIDDLGRIVIPKEFRNTLKIEDGEPFEMFFDNQENIILRKYHG